MNRFSLNLKHLRIQVGLSQAKLADSIGVYLNGSGKEVRFTRANMDSYERGSEPDKEGLRAIANYFSTTIDNLLFEDLSKGFAAIKPLTISEKPSEGNVIYIPTYAQAGLATGFPDQEKDAFPRETIRGIGTGVFYSIPVYGDSMYPTFCNGDRVVCKLVKRDGYIRWGEPYIVVTTDGNMLKRLFPCEKKDECIKLVSDNEAYPAFEVPKSDVLAIYLVIHTGSFNTGKRLLSQ